ncbi:MAG: hypothetical protein ACJATT_004869 [Myxococcota bacterium]|jgi:hypothetical protein
MADPNQPVLPHDYEDGDQEVFRRGRNQVRRRYRRRGRRAKWMAIVEERLPERYVELCEIRRHSPMAFRKALRKTCIELEVYGFVNRCTDRDLLPLEERRRLDDEERLAEEAARAGLAGDASE